MKICIVGDTGSGEHEQYIVSKHIKRYHDTNKLKAILLLGDNIYEEGVDSIHDSQFIDKFELPYKDINLPFYLLLGNHDYANISGVEAFNDYAIHQIRYHQLSKKWNMPKRFAIPVKLGNCEFFMLDTNLENMTNADIAKQISYMKKIKLKKPK